MHRAYLFICNTKKINVTIIGKKYVLGLTLPTNEVETIFR